jgi:hypothetical protein
MRAIRTFISILCACCAMSGSAWAQSAIRTGEWSHGTELNGFAGVAADSTNSGPALGGAVGWQVMPAFAIEGSGTWTEFGEGTNAFGGSLKARMRLFGRRSVDPFVQGGIGMYRATFGPAATRIPDFYRRRMSDPMQIDAFGETFTDPTVIAGGGVNIFLTRHLAIRPDVEATFVLRSGHSHVVTTVALHAVFNFEDHPVTPQRAPRR